MASRRTGVRDLDIPRSIGPRDAAEISELVRERFATSGQEAGKGTILVVNGRPDKPTDGVYDFSRYLTGAFVERGWTVGQISLDWEARGWLEPLQHLWKLLGKRLGWGALQITALAWSRKGFLLPVLIVAGIIRIRGWRLASVLHDPCGWEGSRVQDIVRRRVQFACFRMIGHLSHSVYVTGDPAALPWPHRGMLQRIHLLPVGSNIIPRFPHVAIKSEPELDDMFTVVVFGVTEGKAGEAEIHEIAQVAAIAASIIGGSIRIVAFGRGTNGRVRPKSLPQFIQFEMRGLLDEEEASAVLGRADAMLMVRGIATPRRGSMVAGTAMCPTSW